jgi:hypothetical protein
MTMLTKHMACRFRVDPVTKKPLFSYKGDGIGFMSNRFKSIGIHAVECRFNRLHNNTWVIDPQTLFSCIKTELYNR